MKNWFLPATLLGLSGLALVFASEKGRERVRLFLDDLLEHGDPLTEFNKFVKTNWMPSSKTWIAWPRPWKGLTPVNPRSC